MAGYDTGLPAEGRDPADRPHRRTFVEDSIIARIPLFEGMSPEEQDEPKE